MPKAESLIKRSIKALEMLRRGKGVYEKQIVVKLLTEPFQRIGLEENKKFVCLPRDKLLSSVISNLEKRLVDCTLHMH